MVRAIIDTTDITSPQISRIARAEPARNVVNR